MIKIDFSSIIDERFSSDLASAKPIVNVQAKNGQFQIWKTPLLTTIAKQDNLFADLPDLAESFSLHIPKIPFRIFNCIALFFREIYLRDRTEATAMVFYDQAAQDFAVWIPQQRNASTTSNYDRSDDPKYNALCAEKMLVMVAHSHPWDSASAPGPSGTDNTDEKEPLLYMILSNVSHVPTFFLSTCPNGKRLRLNIEDVFARPVLSRDQMLALLPDCGLDPVYESLLRAHGTDEQLSEVLTRMLGLTDHLASYFQDDLVIPDGWKYKCQAHSYKNYAAPVPSYPGYDDNDWRNYDSRYPRSGWNYNDDEEAATCPIT
jgi:hypothetical protein